MRANGKKDLGVTFDYTHTAGINSGAFFFNIDLPIFDRNQGEIARARFAITQAEEQAIESRTASEHRCRGRVRCAAVQR